MRSTLALIMVCGVVVIGGMVYLGSAIVQTQRSDCHRTRAVVLGIYALVDRSTQRIPQNLRKGIITPKQAEQTREANALIKRTITLPAC